jgi:hypothetical protein
MERKFYSQIRFSVNDKQQLGYIVAFAKQRDKKFL